MAQLGADVEEMDRLAKAFEQEAKAIQAAISKINGKVSGVWWKGRDADQFRSDWSGQFKPGLQKVVTALEQVSRQVKNEAQQQRITSGQG